MKFRFKLPIYVFVGFIVLSVCEFATIMYFACKMFGFFGLISNSLSMEITTTIVCALAMVFSIFMLTLHYKVDDTHVQLKIGFWDIFGKRVQISKIVNVVYKKQVKEVYISYVSTALDPIIALIAIDDKNAELFAQTLLAKSSKIVYMQEH